MLSRPQLQQLAKQHGIKANMKSVDIEAALKELGVALSVVSLEDKTIKRSTGLFVRDMNEMEDCALPVAKKLAAKQKPTTTATRKSVNLYFDEEQDVENRTSSSRPAPRKSLSIELPQYRMATRRSTEKLLLEQQQRASLLLLTSTQPKEDEDETEELTKQANAAAQQEAAVAQRQAEEAQAKQQAAVAQRQAEEAQAKQQAAIALQAAKRQAYARLIHTLNEVYSAYMKQNHLLLLRELKQKQHRQLHTK